MDELNLYTTSSPFFLICSLFYLFIVVFNSTFNIPHDKNECDARCWTVHLKRSPHPFVPKDFKSSIVWDKVTSRVLRINLLSKDYLTNHVVIRLYASKHSPILNEGWIPHVFGKLCWRSTAVCCRFSPAIFLFLISIIPSIWLLELHHQQNTVNDTEVLYTTNCNS